jgi:Arc/MetJ family transcription regulator
MCIALVDEVYDRDVVRRTNINLDTELLGEAAELLGTQRITDTVHAAMREVVDREYRRRLAIRRLFDDVTPVEFEAMRRGRTFEG